ncbi:Conserved hypothetical protein [Leptospira biflexa serovar Patoc strain 'Patoc 1 (Ames)']|uniref:Uncharacterized protein n=1 Tax=Leptospira biflexa serovar Patoc (strain Patoc 1 / ATCC 23582 / Paris) TaxID=456481 RepID=B0ST28_LEPBP|nr:Conserved hypothetical protein [Leptospira biflexa serovar Patoc strain 'Patoc 1 (Ames)']ABZ98268.1 Hypothetical protein LEPBI_I2168 [Leptospira biflexa serovar Patoc strain 'Patoc 1 (Paris)']
MCPEDLSCTIIAENLTEFEILKNTEEFIIDWDMNNLIEIAYSKHGALSTDRKYCLKFKVFWAVLTRMIILEKRNFWN